MHKFLLLFLCCNSLVLRAQEKLTYYDKNFNEINNPDFYFQYLVSTDKKNDTTYFVRTYQNLSVSNRLMKCITFKNDKQTIRHGPFSQYNSRGTITLLGNYTNGKKDGLWIWFNDSLKSTTMQLYVMDSLEKKGLKEDFFIKEDIDLMEVDSTIETGNEKRAFDKKFISNFSGKLKKALKWELKLMRVKSINFYSLFIYHKGTGMQHILLHSFNNGLDSRYLNEITTLKPEDVFGEKLPDTHYYKYVQFHFMYDYSVRRIIGTF